MKLARSQRAASSRRLSGSKLAFLVAVMAIIAGCGAGAGVPKHSQSSPTTRPPGIPKPASIPTKAGPTSTTELGIGGTPALARPHIFVIMMENLSYSQALATPSIATLADRYAYGTNYFAVSHPSLPNYLAMTSGSTFGITTDCLTCYVTSPNLATQLTQTGITWNAFFEGTSQSCYLGTSYGTYAAKHNPFRYFTDVRASTTMCSHLLPFSAFKQQLADGGTSLAAFNWITPNICNDGHDCPAQAAGQWLSGLVSQIVSTSAWRTNGLIIITWDEGGFSDNRQISPTGTVLSTGGGGNALTIFISPRIPSGTRISQPMSNYSILASIEQAYNLPLLNSAAQWKSDTIGNAVGTSAY